MQFYRCKCGNATSWTSMGVPACMACDECGSSLAQSPGGHADTKPHDYVVRYEHNTGRPYEMCRVCMRRRDEIATS